MELNFKSHSRLTERHSVQSLAGRHKADRESDIQTIVTMDPIASPKTTELRVSKILEVRGSRELHDKSKL